MKIIYHKKFAKQHARLSPKIKTQFVERRGLFIKDPMHPLLNNHSVEKTYPGCRSINITGDYRAIFSEFAGGVMFVKIGTHSELYG